MITITFASSLLSTFLVTGHSSIHVARFPANPTEDERARAAAKVQLAIVNARPLYLLVHESVALDDRIRCDGRRH